MAGLSRPQRRIKAQTILWEMGLDQDLSDLSVKLDELLSHQPTKIRTEIGKDELAELVKAVQQGTKDNEKIARFLELAQKLGLG